MLGISPDETSVIQEWKAEIHLPFDLLSDPEARVLSAWGVWGEKESMGKVTMGVIRSHWIIDEQGVVIDAQLRVHPTLGVESALKVLKA